MTETKQEQLGNTLWAIADPLRGAMDADDFRDYVLSFLFLRHPSDNDETAAIQAAQDTHNRFWLELGLKPLP